MGDGEIERLCEEAARRRKERERERRRGLYALSAEEGRAELVHGSGPPGLTADMARELLK